MKRFLVTLSSLCAEGTPVLALELCRHWKRQGLRPYVVVLSADRPELAAEFASAGIDVEYLNLGGGRGRFVRMARQLAAVTKKTGAAALLSFPLGWHAFLGFGAKWGGARTVIAHVGNYPPHWTGSAFEKFRFQVQLGRAVTHRLVCCSDYVREGVVQHFGVPPEETCTVYNGCPVGAYSERAEAARAKAARDAFVVGMVARLEVHKDQTTLIRAAALLKQRGRPVTVWLVGEGSRRTEYETLIASFGLGEEVKLLGTRRDIPELLGQMSAFAFSAKRDEGFGVALVEAMAAGTPVIATDVGACREVLENGRDGKLIPAANAESLASAIETIRNDPDRAQATTAAARERASQFTLTRMADEYLRLLEGVD